MKLVIQMHSFNKLSKLVLKKYFCSSQTTILSNVKFTVHRPLLISHHRMVLGEFWDSPGEFFKQEKSTVCIYQARLSRLEPFTLTSTSPKTFYNDKPSHAIYECAVNFDTDFVIDETTNHLIYLSVNNTEIHNIAQKILDQDSELVYCRGEKIIEVRIETIVIC